LIIGSGGTGTLTGSTGQITITGPTTINSGGAFTGGAGPISISGATAVNSGGALTVGAGTFTLSNSLTLASGATLNTTLPSSPQIGVAGALTLNPNLSINVTQGSGFAINTEYPLVSYGSVTDNSSNQSGWTVTGGPAGYSPSFSLVNNTLELDFITALTSYNGASGTPGTVFGTPASWSVAVGSSYSGYQSEAPNQTTGGTAAANGYGPLLTTDGFGNHLYAEIVAGVNSGNYSGNAGVNLQMAWRNRTIMETTVMEGGSPTSPPMPNANAALISNVVQVLGMSTASGEPVQTDPFVLQMNYNAALLNNEAADAANGAIYLAWLNPNGGGPNVALWQNATLGNFGGPGGDVGSLGGDYQGSFASFLAAEEALDPTDFPGNPIAASLTDPELNLLLGAYGVDITNHDAWAIVNHNSEFAVVPEPSAFALAALAAAGLAVAARRRKTGTQ